ncbi:MAG: type VI secretion system baseplate subunit TssE [Planctomycetota bacterium]
MAELTSQERLQPSLLDRLTDDDPQNQRESRDKRVLNLRRMREGVIRDLSWLLNTGNLDSVEDLEPFPEVVNSVVNYGMPHLSGNTASGVVVRDIEQRIRSAIVKFEPRILSNSIRVRISMDSEKFSHNAMVMEIQGELWAQPVPERLFLKTDIDLETGDVKISDHSGGVM